VALDTDSVREEPLPLVPLSGRLEPLASAGVNLTKWVLIILCVVLTLLIGAAFYQEKQFTDLLTASLRAESAPLVVKGGQPNGVTDMQGHREMLKAYEEVVDASREFWMKLGQMMLLNLLLPVLTALLGYVFGSRSAAT
jgi:hypothetical protein